MSSLTISFVLVRLAAVFLFVRGLQGLSTYSYYLSEIANVPSFGWITLMFSVALPISVSMLLWQYPEKVTGAQPASQADEGPLSASQVLVIGVTLLGLYLFVYGILDLLRVESSEVIVHRVAEQFGVPASNATPELVVERLIYGAQIIFGMLMIVGRRSLSHLLFKAKYGAVASQS